MIVRPELPSDYGPIAALTRAAFLGAAHTDGSEWLIAERLRAADDLTLSLVAEDEGELAGHVAFSTVVISDGTPGWHGLGPNAVVPARQSGGTGTALIVEGLDRLRDIGAGGCVVLGEPGYYRRFGFTHDPGLSYPGPPPEYFQRIVFRGARPHGIVQYSNAFGTES